MGIATGDFVELRFNGFCFDQQIILTHHYRCVSSGSPNTVAQNLDAFLNAVASAGANDIATAYLDCLPPQYAMSNMTAQVLKVSRSAYRVVGNIFVGTNPNPATVACDSASLVLRTALAGRKEVSVKKIGPLGDGCSAGGLLTAATIVRIGVLAGKLLQAITPPAPNDVEFRPVILHPPYGPANYSDLTNHLEPFESRVMRRRVVGRGK